MTRQRRGRPPKLTAEVQEAIVRAVRAGATYRTAAQAAGIAESTFRLWRSQARQGKKQYLAFLAAIKKAQAEFLCECAARVLAAGLETWQANAWMLERRAPDEYGPPKMAELSRRITELERQVAGRPTLRPLPGPGADARH
jgi:hypothetical protein